VVKYILERDFSMQIIDVNLFLCSPFSTPLVKTKGNIRKDSE